uniref:Aquaporin n=1 Tax=Ciona savignyi TaxID=51511 RepID=H2YBV0_CIOSA
ACAASILVAEIFRLTVNQAIDKCRLGHRNSSFLPRFSEIFNSSISAFSYIASTFEKGLLLTVGLRKGFFLVTLILGVLFSYTFARSEPTPIYPLVKHWRLIRLGFLESSHPTNPRKGFVTSSIRSAVTYFKLGWCNLLGQALGLFGAVTWVKYFWDGWLTTHHVSKLATLDECADCQNATVIEAFLIETGLTYMFMVLFHFIDQTIQPQDGAGNPLRSEFMCNVLKNLVGLIAMHFFIDVTGSFANPYLAYAVQRHCLVDVTKAAIFSFVYVIGPFVGTLAYLMRPPKYWRRPKLNRSV